MKTSILPRSVPTVILLLGALGVATTAAAQNLEDQREKIRSVLAGQGYQEQSTTLWSFVKGTLGDNNELPPSGSLISIWLEVYENEEHARTKYEHERNEKFSFPEIEDESTFPLQESAGEGWAAVNSNYTGVAGFGVFEDSTHAWKRAEGGFLCGNLAAYEVRRTVATETYQSGEYDAMFDAATELAREARVALEESIIPALAQALYDANACRAPALSFLPDGVAYDVMQPEPDITVPQSTFANLSITGSGLGDVTEVVVSPSVDLYTTNVRAKDDEVLFDLRVFHSAEPGQRSLILKKGDGSELNVTDRVGKQFVVTRFVKQLNQAVDIYHLPEDKRSLVANKPTVVRIQFDDDHLIGDTFDGYFVMDDLLYESITPHAVKMSYSDREIADGLDHLTMPIPNPGEGSHDVSCILASDDGKVIWCPDREIRFAKSNTLDILGIRYKVRSPQGILDTASREDALAAVDFLERVYPVSRQKLFYVDAGEVELDAEPYTGGTGHFTKQGRNKLYRVLERTLARLTRDAGVTFNIAIAFLPDGILPYSASAVTSSEHCAVLMTNDANLTATVAHEVAHAVRKCLLKTSTFSFPSVPNLGDEYKGGGFSCSVNPPVEGVTDMNGNARCDPSPFQPGVHGNEIGLYSAKSGYDPWSLVPQRHIDGVNTSFNIMSAAGLSRSSYWVSEGTYAHLLSWFVESDAHSKGTGTVPLLVVNGTIFDDDTAVLSEFEIEDAGWPDESSSGPFALELQNASGSTLAEHGFDVEFIEWFEPPVPSDRSPLSIRMALPDDVKYVVLKKEGKELARRTLSDHPPVVAIQGLPDGQTITGSVELTWTATDPDGDPLTYDLFLYSDESSGVGLPIDAGLTEQRYTFDPTRYPSSSDASIVVVASDGVNRSASSAVGLRLPGDAAAPAIAGVSPTAAPRVTSDLEVTVTGENFVDGASVSFSGSGIVVRAVDFVSANRLDATIDVAHDAPLGARDATVTNPGGGQAVLPAAFEVTAFAGLPVTLMWSAPPSGETLVPPQDLVVHMGGSAGKRRNGLVAPVRAGSSPAAKRSSAVQGQADIDEIEPNNAVEEAQVITGASPVSIHGNAEVDDEGQVTLTFDDGSVDDLEDVYRITTTAPGLLVTLDGFDADLDLYVADESVASVVGVSNTIGADYDEEVDAPNLAPGTYFIAVSIFDPDPDGPDESPYVLTVTAELEGTSSGPVLEGFHVYRSGQPNPIATGDRIATVTADTRQFTDLLFDNATYYYRVTAQYDQGESGGSNETTYLVNVGAEPASELPRAVTLIGNYPNPFSPTTRIVFELPSAGDVRLVVYDVLGREVARLYDGARAAGRHEVAFDASALPSGIYLYRLEAGSEVQMRTMTLVR